MSDWQVGDLALCVDARAHPRYGIPMLKEGRAYGVVAVSDYVERHSLYGRSHGGLAVAGATPTSPTGLYAVERFRKIRPDEHEACETEFVTLLKRSKQRVSA